jgi:hypothetical protein
MDELPVGGTRTEGVEVLPKPHHHQVLLERIRAALAG